MIKVFGAYPNKYFSGEYFKTSIRTTRTRDFSNLALNAEAIASDGFYIGYLHGCVVVGISMSNTITRKFTAKKKGKAQI